MLGAVWCCVMSLNKFWGVTTRNSLSLSMQPSDDTNHFNASSCLKTDLFLLEGFHVHQFFLLFYWLQYQQMDVQIPKCLPLILNHFYSLYYELEVRQWGKTEVAYFIHIGIRVIYCQTFWGNTVLLFLFEGVATRLLYDALLKGLYVSQNPMSLCATYWMFWGFFFFFCLFIWM